MPQPVLGCRELRLLLEYDQSHGEAPKRRRCWGELVLLLVSPFIQTRVVFDRPQPKVRHTTTHTLVHA